MGEENVVNFKEIVTIIAAFISLAGVIIVALYTQYKAKKIKFFEVYFSRKADAYEALLKVIDSVSPHDIADLKRLTSEMSCAVLYCSDKNLRAVKAFINYVSDSYLAQIQGENLDISEYLNAKEALLSVFREEIQNCRKFKFD